MEKGLVKIIHINKVEENLLNNFKWYLNITQDCFFSKT
jgi:hypothetical protein